MCVSVSEQVCGNGFETVVNPCSCPHFIFVAIKELNFLMTVINKNVAVYVLLMLWSFHHILFIFPLVKEWETSVSTKVTTRV